MDSRIVEEEELDKGRKHSPDTTTTD
jgi:hypothetical protein